MVRSDFACPSDPNALKMVQTMQLGIQYLNFTLLQTQQQLSKTQAENHALYQRRQQLKAMKTRQNELLKPLRRLDQELDLS